MARNIVILSPHFPPHYHRFWLEGEKRGVSLRVSNAGLRLIDKKGIEAVLKDLREQGKA